MSGLPPHLHGLLAPEAYPHTVQSVTLIQTHISWVLLTGQWAYKIKRAVHYPFIDLRSAEHRAFLCREELRLNQRFAPGLYVAVCPITHSQGQAHMGGSGEVIEHAVKMRQFPPEETLDRVLDTQPIGNEVLAQFGCDLARIHATLPVSTPHQEWGRAPVVSAQVLDNLAQCATAAAVFADTDTVKALRSPLAAALARAQSGMAARSRAGRVRECHGDLHCGNILRQGTQLLAFDCLEFDPALRWMDVVQDVATLLADLRARNQPVLAAAFLDAYLAHSGDYQACRLLNLYQAHRALVRAKVMALNANNAMESHDETSGTEGQYRRHIHCAQDFLSSRHPKLILMYGVSGSGKTWLAQRLAPSLAAVHLSSDRERKRMADGDPTLERYSPEARAKVYQHLAHCARDTLAGGYTTFIDATFGAREQRAQFQALAASLAVPVCLVRCRAPPELLLARIDARLRERRDLSQANQDVLAWQEHHTELISPNEGFKIYDVDSADPQSAPRLHQSLAALS